MRKDNKQLAYFIERYVRLGEMPLFLIFCRDRRGLQHYCLLLRSVRKLRRLVHLRGGFTNPAQYGSVLSTSHSGAPNEQLREILKARYDFDLDASAMQEVRVFEQLFSCHSEFIVSLVNGINAVSVV